MLKFDKLESFHLFFLIFISSVKKIHEQLRDSVSNRFFVEPTHNIPLSACNFSVADKTNRLARITNKFWKFRSIVTIPV
jgi:hypothetical protein